MTMKENWKETTFDSRCLGRESDALAFGSKERFVLNDSRMDASLTELEAKDRDDFSNFKVVDVSFVDDENGTTASPWKEGQNGLSRHLVIDNGTIDFHTKESKDGQAHHVSGWDRDKDADSLSSDSYDMDKERGSPERKSFDTVEELADCNGSDSRDSSSPLFTDKNILESDLPEVEVCYREIDCQMLKDICVDEGRPEKDSNAIENCMFPLPPNDNGDHEAKEDPLMDANIFTGDQCGSKEENDRVKFISQEKLDSCLENAVESSEACFDGAGKVETNSSNGSLADRKLPNETFGSLPDQALDQAVPECPAASSAEAGCMEKDVQASCLAYNSKIENGTIIFNFSSPDGVVVGNGMAEDVMEQSAESGDVHKDVNAENVPAAVEAKVQFTSNGDDSQQQSLVSNEGNSDSRSDTNEGSLKHKQENSDDISLDDGPVKFPSSKSPVATNNAQVSEANAPNHDKRESGDVPVANHLQQDMGETSFSAASMITYSGPIAYSRSLSHRSDGSTTSGKSFAFPVLQSEWNSSPVRMAKADRRDFRKHKGWRSGLLCCRF